MNIYDKVPRNILIVLNETPLTLSRIARLCDFQYASVWKSIRELESNGFIQTERRRRVKVIWLTDFGRKVSNLLKRIDRIVSKNVSKV